MLLLWSEEFAIWCLGQVQFFSCVLKIPKSENSRHISAFKSRENVWKMERKAAVDPVDSSQVYNGHQSVSQCSDNKKMPHWATKTNFLILKTGYCQSFKWHNKSIEGNQFLFQCVQQRGSCSVGSVLRMCEQGLWGSGLTPVSDVVKVCKHLLLADCQKPWLTRWSQYRCLWGEFIVKVTNIFTAFDGRHKWGLDLLCQ